MTLQMMIKQNNTTIAFLEQQKYYDALASSTAAMALLQEETRTRISSDTTAVSSSTVTACPRLLDQCMLLSTYSIHRMDGPDCDDIPFVYDRGIIIPSSSISSTLPIELLSAILIFNSALAHQLYAQEQREEEETSRMLARSKRLYELSYQAWLDWDSERRANILFEFAVLNNLAVIEYQTDNLEVSEEYFEYLEPLWTLLLFQQMLLPQILPGYLRNFQRKQAALAA